MDVISIPLSEKSKLPELSKTHVVVPIGVGYKKFLDTAIGDSHFSMNNNNRNYALIINHNNEVNIHYVINEVLDISNSDLIEDFSIKYLLTDVDNEIKISSILNIHLNRIFTIINAKGLSIPRIIYLEDGTDYLHKYKKLDSYLITDPDWLIKENAGMKLLKKS